MTESHGNASVSSELEDLIRSLARLDFFRVLMEPTAAWHRDNRLIEEHLRWLSSREAEGSLLLSGPIGPGDSWDGTGMCVLRGESQQEVEALVKTEPFAKAGLRVNTVQHWQVNEGSLTLRVNLLAGRGSLQ
jgi:uncharacterized protein